MPEETPQPQTPGKQPGDLEKKIQTILLTVITALIMGCFNFLWDFNKEFGAMQERERLRTQDDEKWKEEQMRNIKETRIEFNELTSRVIKLEMRVDDAHRNANP